MKISYNWLRQYHNLDFSPDKVAELLTACGLEVEGIEPFESVRGGLEGIVIGEVLTCIPHPNSDHLSLTTVDTGGPEPLRIVCGASNVAAGQKVAVATIGAKMWFGDKEVTIQRTKLRGELSEGMICAEDELGLGTSHAGILVLDPSAGIGMPAREYFNVENDFTLVIGLTPNRVDAASHIGVARDLVAVANHSGGTGIGGNTAELQLPDVSGFSPDDNSLPVAVVVEDPVACPRYTGLTVSGIRVEESPAWLKNRLLCAGLRPINNIVDITNYVLLETGQPLHAFDCSKIEGNTIVVKKESAGKRFTTLDSVERELTAGDLMICNASEPMCIAGVFGGIHSGVTEQTTSVFLESAYFDPGHIRKSSKHHGLQTDASFRFERGADPTMTVTALKRAALLIREIAGGHISSGIADVSAGPVKRHSVNLSYEGLDRLIGKKIGRETVKGILTDLGFGITPEGNPETGLRLEVPPAKVDVTREADVIEEVLRIYGYNNIEFPGALRASLSYTPAPDPEQLRNVTADYLASCGFTEIMSNSLTKSDYYRDLKLYPADKLVAILNPLSRDLDAMRQTLLFGVLEAIVYNQNRQAPDLKLFEFGNVYAKAEPGRDPVSGYHEERRLALALTGRMRPENWNAPEQRADFYDLRGFAEALMARISVPAAGLTTETISSEMFSEGICYRSDGQTLLTAGAVRPELLRAFDCRQSVFYAEIDWNLMLSLSGTERIRFAGLPRFPEVRRDLALVVDLGVTFAEIEKAAADSGAKHLQRIGLFDVYEGDKVAQGKKSYAVSLTLRSDDRTLTDQEIEKSVGQVMQALKSKFGAELR